MPIISQFRADGPAQPIAPQLEAVQRTRVDASTALRGLAELSGAVGQVAQPLPNAPETLGQGEMRGLAAIGAGVRDVGQAMFEVRERIAEARVFSEVSAAQAAMDREVGEFEKWRMNNPDPSKWEGEWMRRLDTFKGSYLTGRELAPAAQDAITQRIVTFGERHGINVGLDAAKAEIGRARESLEAEIVRATKAGDLATVSQLADYGFQQGWIPEDTAERMKFQAQDEIEAQQVEVLQNQKKTAILYGDEQAALDAVEQMPLRDDEKALERAAVTEQVGYQLAIQEAEDILDPNERIRRIEAGEFDRLRPSDRQALLNASYQEMNALRAETVRSLGESIKAGASLRDLETTDAFRSLPDSSKMALAALAEQGAKNDVSEYLTALRSAQAYDPTKDPRGEELAALQEAAALSFEGERANAILSALSDSSKRTAPQSATERVMSDYFSNLQRRYDAGELGGFRVTGADIKKRKDANGIEVYTVPDPNGQAFPGTFGTYKGRVIQLSEEDRIRYESGKTGSGDVYEDSTAKEAAFSRFLSVQQELEAKVKAGELTSADEIQAEGNRLLGGELEKALESRIMDRSGQELPGNSFGGPSNALFPSDPDADLEWLNSLSLPAQATF